MGAGRPATRSHAVVRSAGRIGGPTKNRRTVTRPLRAAGRGFLRTGAQRLSPADDHVSRALRPHRCGAIANPGLVSNYRDPGGAALVDPASIDASMPWLVAPLQEALGL